MRYFLTGSTGFLGGQLLQELLDEGHSVHALVRDRAKAGAIFMPMPQVGRGD
jgi:uncharacterized protein YbjT (DUF2867 family)